VIPEAAVEAAVAAVQQETYGADWAARIARIAVNAAAPHMTERAYNAGHLDGMNGAPNSNPYRDTK